MPLSRLTVQETICSQVAFALVDFLFGFSVYLSLSTHTFQHPLFAELYCPRFTLSLFFFFTLLLPTLTRWLTGCRILQCASHNRLSRKAKKTTNYYDSFHFPSCFSTRCGTGSHLAAHQPRRWMRCLSGTETKETSGSIKQAG